MNISNKDITEIIGRANSGKSHLLNQIILDAIHSDYKVIYLDSIDNANKMVETVKGAK